MASKDWICPWCQEKTTVYVAHRELYCTHCGHRLDTGKEDCDCEQCDTVDLQPEPGPPATEALPPDPPLTDGPPETGSAPQTEGIPGSNGLQAALFDLRLWLHRLQAVKGAALGARIVQERWRYHKSQLKKALANMLATTAARLRERAGQDGTGQGGQPG